MKVAFLDRDGVLNIDYRYVHTWDSFVWVPGAIEALQRLRDMKFKLIVITNQSGIARGFYSENDFHILMEQIKLELQQYNVQILDVFFCPHHKDGNVIEYKTDCNCRKPKPGMILKAIKKYMVSLSESILVGDQETDIIAGKSAGINRCFKVDSCTAENIATFEPNSSNNSLLSVAKNLQNI